MSSITSTSLSSLDEMWNHKDTDSVVQSFLMQSAVDDVVATTPPRPIGLVVRYIGDEVPHDFFILRFEYPYPIYFNRITNRKSISVPLKPPVLCYIISLISVKMYNYIINCKIE